ncbi:MAG: 3'(2'),5'-bisphosphate nucleotidase CysQ family protein, partial [Rhodanobacteraceae bacterium]
MSALERIAHESCVLARSAGAAILEVYAGSFAIETKSDNSPLTAADMASHRIIVDGLSALTPDIPVLSEESKDVDWSIRRGWERYWLVDPLDGTREFVKRNGEFTVNIALIENHAPVLGVVLLPVTGELYYGVAGEGAFLESVRGALPKPVATRAVA